MRYGVVKFQVLDDAEIVLNFRARLLSNVVSSGSVHFQVKSVGVGDLVWY